MNTQTEDQLRYGSVLDLPESHRKTNELWSTERKIRELPLSKGWPRKIAANPRFSASRMQQSASVLVIL